MTITELSQQDPITHVHIAEIGSVGFVLFCLYTVSTAAKWFPTNSAVSANRFDIGYKYVTRSNVHPASLNSPR